MSVQPAPRGAAGADFSTALGARLGSLRRRAGLSRRALAERAGISARTLGAVEEGRSSPSAVQLTAMAEVLGVDVGELVDAVHRASLGEVGPPVGGDWRAFDDARFDGPLQAALDVFASTGYHGATMRQIAERAGLSVPGVYHHYASKQQMLVEVLTTLMREVVWRCEAAVADADGPVEAFAHVVECLTLVHTRRGRWGLVGRNEIRSVEEPDRQRIRDLQRRVQDLVAAQVELGVRAGHFHAPSPRRTALDVVMMCVGASEWFRHGGRWTPEQVARQHVEQALRLVAPEPLRPVRLAKGTRA